MSEITYLAEIEELKQNVVKLEQENKKLIKERFLLLDFYKETIDKIFLPIVIFAKNGEIEFANEIFSSLLSFRGRELAEGGDVHGMSVRELVGEGIFVHLEPFVSRGVTFTDKDIVVNDVSYSLSLFAIRKGEFAMALFRKISTREELGEEVILRINNVMETNFEMIQKIGSLMGEEVSRNTETLSSIIKMLK